jgi:bifunctional non-homologous end joining protein LigD
MAGRIQSHVAHARYARYARYTRYADIAIADLPEWIEPMAATLTQERFAGPEWTFERKFDGIRLVAFKRGHDVRLYSRTRQPKELPAIAGAIERLPVRDAILDGELTWGAAGIAYHVFDIVWLDGRDLAMLPLVERRAVLATLPLAAPLHRVVALDHVEPWTCARDEGWEGVIAKRLDSPYEQKRSKLWLKMKCERSQDFVVGGFTDPQGARTGLGALLVGYYDGPDFVFAGKVGTGFDTALLTELRARLDALEIEKTPFTRATGLPRVREHWVKPDVVVYVAFIEWTVHDKLRHSRLLCVRTDRAAREVVRESPRP